MRWPWSKRTVPVPVKSEPVDAHTYCFGAPQSVPETEPEKPFDDVFVRVKWPEDFTGKATFHNMEQRTLEDARDYALKGLRRYAMGENKYCPIAIVRVRWKGALRRAIDERESAKS